MHIQSGRHINFSPKSVGKQCIENCVMSIIYTFMTPVDMWWSEHLDCILVVGSKLNFEIGSQHDYLQISVIPEFVAEYSRSF